MTEPGGQTTGAWRVVLAILLVVAAVLSVHVALAWREVDFYSTSIVAALQPPAQVASVRPRGLFSYRIRFAAASDPATTGYEDVSVGWFGMTPVFFGTPSYEGANR